MFIYLLECFYFIVFLRDLLNEHARVTLRRCSGVLQTLPRGRVRASLPCERRLRGGPASVLNVIHLSIHQSICREINSRAPTCSGRPLALARQRYPAYVEAAAAAPVAVAGARPPAFRFFY